MTAPRVLATAIADPVPGSADTWLITVTGEPPYGETRRYEIAGDKNRAAMSGIDRFVAEMTERSAVNAEGMA